MEMSGSLLNGSWDLGNIGGGGIAKDHVLHGTIGIYKHEI